MCTSSASLIELSTPQPNIMQLYSERKQSAPGYLELIYNKDPKANHTQAIAYVTSTDDGYSGHYGIYEVTGSTVASVKEELFSIITEGN